MAFPTTSVIDDFARANSTTDFGSNWTTCFGDPDSGGISSGQAYSSDGGWRGQYWNPATFGPDCEAYVKVATPNAAAGAKLFIFARANGLPSSATGYVLVSSMDSSTNNIYLSKMTGTGPPGTGLGAAFSQAISAGDSLGIECIGNQIAAWYKAAAGSWTQLGVRTDSTYSGAGYVGFEFNTTVTRLDDFSGGLVSALTLDSCLPDADVVTTGWSTAPLFSKVNDASDATVIQATAS